MRTGTDPSAEPDFRVEALVTPNDPGMSSLWGLSRIQAPQAWETTTGVSGTVVAVIDSGVDYSIRISRRTCG